jgi:hypothetical protein
VSGVNRTGELSARNSERTNQHYSLLPTPYSLLPFKINYQQLTINHQQSTIITEQNIQKKGIFLTQLIRLDDPLF